MVLEIVKKRHCQKKIVKWYMEFECNNINDLCFKLCNS